MLSELVNLLRAAGHNETLASGELYLAAADRIAELEARLDAVMPLLEKWMLYYTDGIPDDDLCDLYFESVEALWSDDET
jgi:hypothetical protein